jgi:hypothetical protein
MKATRYVLAVGVVSTLIALSSGAVRAQRPGEALNPQFEQLVERYLKEVRGVGGREPDDMSAQSFAQQLDTRRRILNDLSAIDRKSLSFDQDIDYRFLESILKSDILWNERVKRWQQDPRDYLQTRGISYKLEVDPRPPAERAADLIEDLKLLQTRLANGQKNLSQHIPRWVELSHAMLNGTITIFEKDLPAFAERVPAQTKAALLAENSKTLAALKNFRTFLSSELPQKPPGDWKIGAELFNLLHETKYLFDDNDVHLRRIARGMPGFTRVPAYHDWGWKQFGVIERQLEVKAKQIDPTRTWLQIIRDMKQDHPSAEQLVYAHHEAARKTREWVIEKDLVTIPWKDDDSIMQAAPPSMWSAQWWGFGPGVPAGSKSRKSAWTIIPVDPDWPDDVAEENLSEKDWSFMYAIATHEVYPGHHLQRLYANQNPRRLRVYESSYSNQSWCYYIEWELTPSYGFYPKDKQELYTLEMLRLKLWRLGRVIIDSGLHTGRLGYDAAVKLESERIGFVRRGGQINIDGITEGGSGTAAPTLGYFEWMLLREDYFRKMRELDQKGTLKDFHDRVYKIGFLPVKLVREALFHQLEQEFARRPATNE